MFGLSKLHSRLTTEDRQVLTEELGTALNVLANARLNELKEELRTRFQPLTTVNTAAELRAFIAETNAAKTVVNPINAELHSAVGNVIDTIIDEYEGLLTPEEIETDKQVIFTAVLITIAGRILEEMEEVLEALSGSVRHLTQIMEIKESLNAALTENRVATDGIVGQQQDTTAGVEDGSSTVTSPGTSVGTRVSEADITSAN
jgi:hypothetical protein